MKLEEGTVVKSTDLTVLVYYVVASRRSLIAEVEGETGEDSEVYHTQYILELVREKKDDWKRIPAVHKDPEEFEYLVEQEESEFWLPYEDLPEDTPEIVVDLKERVQ